jgi:hypothetical protein
LEKGKIIELFIAIMSQILRDYGNVEFIDIINKIFQRTQKQFKKIIEDWIEVLVED